MSQRVNIQYSVRIEDLEEEVQRLASKAFSILEDRINLSDKIGLSDINLSVKGHGKVDDLRMSLSEVDAILADVNMIIGSFLTYKSQQMMQSVQRPPNPLTASPEDPSAGIPEYSDLHEKLSNFKSKLENVESGGLNDTDIR